MKDRSKKASLVGADGEKVTVDNDVVILHVIAINYANTTVQHTFNFKSGLAAGEMFDKMAAAHSSWMAGTSPVRTFSGVDDWGNRFQIDLQNVMAMNCGCMDRLHEAQAMHVVSGEKGKLKTQRRVMSDPGIALLRNTPPPEQAQTPPSGMSRN